MLQPQSSSASRRSSGDAETFTLALARDPDEVREAQRLRYAVFAEEMGVCLSGRESGIDSDLYDPWCDHLIVRAPGAGAVVGTYRLLHGANARRLGGFYSDEAFDLTRLAALRSQIVEVGRTCVHQDYRNGTVIALLWSGVLRYLAQHGYRYAMGCASMGMADGGQRAASVYHRLEQTCASPVEYRVFPRLDLPYRPARQVANASVPSLIRGYVRLGAFVCGAPAWDPDFGTADLLMLLPVSRLPKRYARYFRAPA